MVHYVSAVEPLFNLDELQLHARPKFVQANSDLRVLLFVQVVGGQSHFRAGQIVHLAFRAVGVARCLALSLEEVVGNVVEAGQVGHFLVVDQLLEAAIDRPLPCTDSVVAELYLVCVCCLVKHDQALAGGDVEVLDFEVGEHGLNHQTDQLEGVVWLLVLEAVHHQQRRRLQRGVKDFGVLLGFLSKLDDVFCKSILLEFEGQRGAFGGLDDFDVVAVLRLRKREEVRHA